MTDPAFALTAPDVPSTAAGGGQGLIALIVDDEAINRMVLAGLLREHGFRLREAANGREAIDQVGREPPDLIFMDIMMPEMDGHEATIAIKAMLGERFVPIIFLTAVTDEALLYRSIEIGGDDFLVKPYSRALLNAKIMAALRMRAMQQRLALRRDELMRHRNRLHNDMDVAKRILHNVGSQQHLAAPNVRYLLRPMELLSGDLILAAIRPSGEQCFLVGDFTGHGLPAAIGAQTVQAIFNSMVAKGLPIEDILIELNRKLCGLLPVGRFLSACVCELDGDTGLLRVWNGGMPDVLIRAADGGVVRRFPSSHVPLGILGPQEYEIHVEAIALAAHDQVYIYSDGVTEAHDPEGELFGVRRLQAAIESRGDSAEAFDATINSLARHVRDATQSDDVSLLQLTYVPGNACRQDAGESGLAVTQPAQRWDFMLEIAGPDIAGRQPVPVIMQVLEGVQGLGAHRSALFMVLTELYSNAVEHGLLGLDSATKRHPDGFARYYAERQSRLHELARGRIAFELHHQPATGGGQLEIRVAHDGIGFDPGRLPGALGDDEQPSGRGIRLVRSLCRSLDYSADGRTAIASYVWQSGSVK